MCIRPVTFGGWGVYASIGENRAEVVFEGTYQECLEYVKFHNR